MEICGNCFKVRLSQSNKLTDNIPDDLLSSFSETFNNASKSNILVLTQAVTTASLIQESYKGIKDKISTANLSLKVPEEFDWDSLPNPLQLLETGEYPVVVERSKFIEICQGIDAKGGKWISLKSKKNSSILCSIYCDKKMINLVKSNLHFARKSEDNEFQLNLLFNSLYQVKSKADLTDLKNNFKGAQDFIEKINELEQKISKLDQVDTEVQQPEGVVVNRQSKEPVNIPINDEVKSRSKMRSGGLQSDETDKSSGSNNLLVISIVVFLIVGAIYVLTGEKSKGICFDIVKGDKNIYNCGIPSDDREMISHETLIHKKQRWGFIYQDENRDPSSNTLKLIKSGALNGQLVTYHKGTSLKYAKVKIKDGLRVGETLMYWKTGQLKMRILLNLESIMIKREDFLESGEVVLIMNYDNQGELIDKWDRTVELEKLNNIN
jgi:hypothetical protein